MYMYDNIYGVTHMQFFDDWSSIFFPYPSSCDTPYFVFSDTQSFEICTVALITS